jgi:hypothetical protein
MHPDQTDLKVLMKGVACQPKSTGRVVRRRVLLRSTLWRLDNPNQFSAARRI